VVPGHPKAAGRVDQRPRDQLERLTRPRGAAASSSDNRHRSLEYLRPRCPQRLALHDDLQLPSAGLCDSDGGFQHLIAYVGEDALDEREPAPGTPIKDQCRAVTIPHVGRVDERAIEFQGAQMLNEV